MGEEHAELCRALKRAVEKRFVHHQRLKTRFRTHIVDHAEHLEGLLEILVAHDIDSFDHAQTVDAVSHQILVSTVERDILRERFTVDKARALGQIDRVQRRTAI